MEAIRKLWRRVTRRRHAYRHLFLDQDGKLSPIAEIVMADLKRFCRAQTSTAQVSPVSKQIDPLAMAMAEGRREEWNRIVGHLHISDREIAAFHEPSDE